MSNSGSSDLLNDLAHEFAERCRRGEQPALTEYTDRYPHLAAEIRDLFPALAVMEELGSVGAPVTGPYPGPAQWDARPPELMGEYRILREVARGGMGIVYEAVQESLGRHVALKVLPRQSLSHPTHLERFRREAKAAARLHHTNIVPVFGVGEHDGVHYYAMQFIDGQGLDSVLQEVKKLRSRDAVPLPDEAGAVQSADIARSLVQGFAEPVTREIPEMAAHTRGDNVSTSHGHADLSNLSGSGDTPYFRSVAQLALQVAEGLAHAHGQGVIHRDIKPSNLLLDTQGTVWITDFGLAKAEGTEDLTSPGDIVGTLRYMAPERFQGRCDARSDVYSLGLTLYELLTLRPAFAASERAQLIDRLLHDQPARPRVLDPRIPRDLEMIVLKAMARDPGDRYATAAALAEDLRCYLADRPILARRTPVWERTWRWCKRNPGVARLSAALVLVLLAATIGSIMAAFMFRQLANTNERIAEQKEEQRKQAVDNANEAEKQKRRAVASEIKARAVVREYLVKVTESQLLTAPGLQPLRRDLLTAALHFYEGYLKENANDPTLRADIAAIYLLVGRIYSDMGQGREARQVCHRAQKLYEALLQEEPKNHEFQHALGQCHYWGASDYARAVEIWEKVVVAAPNNAEYLRSLATAYNSLAIGERDRKAPAESLRLNQKALVIREKLVQQDQDNLEHRNDLGSTLNNIGVLLGDRGLHQEALQMYRRAAEHEEVAYFGAPHMILYGRFLSTSYTNIAFTSWRLNQRDEAMMWQEKGVTLLRRLVGDNPAVPILRSRLWAAYSTQASYQRQLGKLTEANLSTRLARDVIERMPRVTANDYFELARVHAQCAELVAEGKPKLSPEEEAERKIEADLAIQALGRSVGAGLKETSSLKTHEDFALLRDRADFKELVGRVEAAAAADALSKGITGNPAVRLASLQKVVEARRKVFAADTKSTQATLDLAAGLLALGAVQSELSQTGEALKSVSEALTLRQTVQMADPKNVRRLVDVAAAEVALGGVEWKAGRYADGSRRCNQGLARLEAALQAEPFDNWLRNQSAHQDRAVALVYADAGLWDATAQHFARAFERGADDFDVEDWRLQALLRLLEGDTAGYRKHCEQLVKRFGQSSVPRTRAHVAAACLMGSEPVGDLAEWIRHQEEWSKLQRSWGPFHVGLAYYRAGRYDEAIKAAEQAATLPGSWPLLAMAYQRAGKKEEARKWLTKTDEALDNALRQQAGVGLLTDPLHVAGGPWINNRPQFLLLYREAKSLIEGPKAEDPYKRLTANRPGIRLGQSSEADLAANLHAVGTLQSELGQPDAAKSLAEALALREALVKKHPQDGESKADLAGTQIALGNLAWKAERYAEGAQWWEKALANFDLALREAPQNKQLLAQAAYQGRAVGERYAEIGLWGDAARHSRKVVERQPSDNQFLHHASLFLLAGDATGYQRYCTQLLERFGKTTDDQTLIELALACALTREGSSEPAHLLRIADKLRAGGQKDHWRIMSVVSLAYYRSGRYEEAIRAAEALQEQIVSWPIRAMAHHRLGQADKAREYLDRHNRWSRKTAESALTGTSPKIPLGHWTHWAFHQILRREARELIEGKPAPDDPWLRLLTAHALALLGRTEKAEAEFQAAVKAAPRDAEIWLARARLFVSLGRPDRAEADFTKAIDIKSDDPINRMVRGRFYTERGDHKKADADLAQAARLSSDELNRFLEAGWWVAGPYPRDLELPCPPEVDADPSRPVAAYGVLPTLPLGAPTAGLDLLGSLALSQYHWKLCKPEGHGLMIQRGHPALDKNLENVSVYAVTYVYSPDERQATFLVGGDDMMRLWVNGRLVHETTKILGNEAALDRVSVTLRPGRNTLLVKVNNYQGGFYFRVRITDNPRDRGFALVGVGLWDEAATALGKAVEREPDNAMLRRYHLQVMLASGDVEGYRRQCQQLVDHLGNTNDAGVAWNVAAACGLSPAGITDPARLIAFADVWLKAGFKEPWRMSHVGLAHYRAGKFAEAVRHMEALGNTLLDTPVLAMAHHRLGHADKARRWLAQADQSYHRWLRDVMSQSSLQIHVDSVWLPILLREAKELIEGKPPPPDHRLHLLRARAFAQLGQEQKAAAEIQAALALKPDDAHIWIDRGRSFAERGDHNKADADLVKAASLTADELNRFLEAGWWVAGPYPRDLKLPCPPEVDADPSRPVAAYGVLPLLPLGSPTAGLDLLGSLALSQYHWKLCKPEGHALTIQRGHPTLERKARDVSIYAVTYVYSPDDRQATLMVGGDDHLRLWVNGQLVHETSTSADQRVAVTLKRGRNTLLLKLNNYFGNFYFRVRLADNVLDRSDLAGEMGLWPEAARHYAQVFKEEQNDGLTWYSAALAHLLAGDEASYQRHCAALREWSIAWPENVDLRSYVLSPKGAEVPWLLQLARKVAEKQNKSNWAACNLGMACYRAGQYEEALKHIQRARELGEWHLFWPTLAMTHHRLGQADKAREWLDKAHDFYSTQLRQAATRTPFKIGPDAFWQDWAYFEVFLREAKTLIEGKPPQEDALRRLLRGKALVLFGQAQQGAAEMQAALEPTTKEAHLWIARGRFHAEQGDHKKADADFAKAATLSANELHRFLESGWWVVGPFPGDVKTAQPVETEADPSRPVAIPGSDLTKQPWRFAPGDGSIGLVELGPLFNNALDISAYALSYVYSPDERTALLRVGGSRDVRLWLNGRLIYEASPAPGWEWALDAVPVTLRPGRNVLLARVARGAAPLHRLFVRLSDNPLDRAWELAMLGLWEEGASASSQTFRTGPAPDLHSYRLNTQLVLANGDVEGYLRACKRMLAHWDADSHRDIAFNLAFAACWAEGAVDPKKLLQMARQGQVPDQPSENYRRWTLAVALVRAGEPDKALPILDEFANASYTWPVLALAHHRMKKPEVAREWLKKADKFFADATVHSVEGETFTPPRWNGHYFAEFWIMYREAKFLLDGSVDEEKKRVKAVQARGREWLQQQAKATASFDLALLLRPDLERLWLARGRRHGELRQWDKAASDLKKAAELKPDDPLILAELGCIFAEQDKPEQAAAEFSRALDLLPAPKMYWEERAPFEVDLGGRAAVIAQLAKLRPQDKWVWIARVKHQAMRHNWKEASQAATRWTELDPDDAFSWYSQSILSWGAGDIPGCRRACREMVTRFGQTKDVVAAHLTVKACLLLPDTVGDLKPVMALAARADYPGWFATTSGMANYRAGQYPAAIKQLRAALVPVEGYAPRGALNYLFLAMTQHQLGQADEAKKAMTQARAIVEKSKPQRTERPDLNEIEWLRVEAVQREAEALLAAKAPDPKK